MSNSNTFKMHLRCHNCGHQWQHLTTKGERLYLTEEIGFSAIGKDVGKSSFKDFFRNYPKVICPHCEAFSDIINITTAWAPPNGYGSNNLETEEDNPKNIAKAKEEKSKAKQKVIDMQEEKK